MMGSRIAAFLITHREADISDESARTAFLRATALTKGGRMRSPEVAEAIVCSQTITPTNHAAQSCFNASIALHNGKLRYLEIAKGMAAHPFCKLLSPEQWDIAATRGSEIHNGSFIGLDLVKELFKSDESEDLNAHNPYQINEDVVRHVAQHASQIHQNHDAFDDTLLLLRKILELRGNAFNEQLYTAYSQLLSNYGYPVGHSGFDGGWVM